MEEQDSGAAGDVADGMPRAGGRGPLLLVLSVGVLALGLLFVGGRVAWRVRRDAHVFTRTGAPEQVLKAVHSNWGFRQQLELVVWSDSRYELRGNGELFDQGELGRVSLATELGRLRDEDICRQPIPDPRAPVNKGQAIPWLEVNVPGMRCKVTGNDSTDGSGDALRHHVSRLISRNWGSLQF